MSKFIYTGPRQTIPVKTEPASKDKPAKFKDVELVPGKPLTIDEGSALFVSLKSAGFTQEASTAKAPPSSMTAKPNADKSAQDKE